MTVAIGSYTKSGTGAVISNALLSADSTRRFTSISNMIAVPVCLAIGTGAVYGMGICLPATIGSTVTFNRDNFCNALINVVGTADIINVAYQSW